MTGSISRMRKRLQERSASKSQTISAVEQPVNIHHGWADGKAYMRIEPIPPNGYIGFTLEQYLALIADMEKTARVWQEEVAAAKVKN